MGKRSDFDRIEKDFYRTIDNRAGIMLDRIMEYKQFNKLDYYEPCAGSGDLIENLNKANHSRFTCLGQSDIDTGKDALSLSHDDVKGVDFIITNPPWSRPLLHPMILHFIKLKPTFLLFDSDWSQNKGATPYLPYCRGIYPIGRLKWIPDTTMQSKDNCAWYLFDYRYQVGDTEFVNLR